jgi:hypothetical protein
VLSSPADRHSPPKRIVTIAPHDRLKIIPSEKSQIQPDVKFRNLFASKRSFTQVYVFSVFSLHGGAGSLGQVRAGIKAVKG